MENKTAVEQLIEELNDIKFNKCTTLLETMFFDGVLAIIEGKYIELEKQQAIDLVQSLKDYTLESQTVLGNDEREASEFVEIYYETTYKK